MLRLCVNKFNSQFKNQMHLKDNLQFVNKVSNLYRVPHSHTLYLYRLYDTHAYCARDARPIYRAKFSISGWCGSLHSLAWYDMVWYGTCVLLPFWLWWLCQCVLVYSFIESCRFVDSPRLLILHKTKRKSIIGIAN